MISNILLHHNFIRIASCIIGYTLWAFIAQYQHMNIEQNIPVCFYKTPHDLEIKAPDTIKISISGKRHALYHFDTDNSGIHLNATGLQPGTHEMKLTRENLFLPDTINLVNLKPSYITISVSKKDESK